MVVNPESVNNPPQVEDFVIDIQNSRLGIRAQRELLAKLRNLLSEIREGAEYFFDKGIEEVFDRVMPDALTAWEQISGGKPYNSLTPQERWLWDYYLYKITNSGPFSSRQLPLLLELDTIINKGEELQRIRG